MKVIVDTCVWSLALRRRKKSEHPSIIDQPSVIELRELIKEVRVQMIGPIRQEILSGVQSQSQFENLRNRLSAFPDLNLTAQDYERAAEFFNICRRKGIQGANTDFLICAVSERNEMPVLTIDKDFKLFAEHIPVKLHSPRTSNG